MFGVCLLVLFRPADGRLTSHSNGRGLKFDDDSVDVIVGYKNRAAMPSSKSRHFERTNAVAMQIPVGELDTLKNDPNVAYVEEDTVVHLFAEKVPWGIPAIQADTLLIPRPNTDDVCFKICIVDSGLLVRHPDIVSPFVRSLHLSSVSLARPHWSSFTHSFFSSCQPYVPALSNVEGSEFSLPENERWDQPIDYHGTHVSGIILAQGGNNEGIVGVIPSNQNMCVLVARAFGDDAVVGALTSATSLAVEWCADNGARVINMSLGGGRYTETSRALMQKVTAEGILVIAAAGNDGNATLKYPASYDDVMSVAAVDFDLRRASFSQFNSGVDIAAPGVDINSTIPTLKVFKNGDDINSKGYDAKFMGYSPLVNDPIEANLIDCFKGYITCVGAEGKVCLIERGDNTFKNKATNCQNGGGIAAIIYNNDRNEGVIAGNLGSAGAVNIPVVEVDRQNALELRNASSVLIDMGFPSYATVEGTSAAAPFVSGVAARIWSARPQCTNNQVRQALERSALDLGNPGRDDLYGHGLVQAKAAYFYLLSLPTPCGDIDELAKLTSTRAPAPAPVISPTLIRKTVTKSDKGNFIISDASRIRGSGRERALKGSGPTGKRQQLR